MTGFYSDDPDGDLVVISREGIEGLLREVLREELERMARRRLLYPPGVTPRERPARRLEPRGFERQTELFED